MTEGDQFMVEIVGNHPPVSHQSFSVISEWERCNFGSETTKDPKRQRYMEMVPPSLLKTNKGREYYEPAVVSLGPYHHNRTDLARAEKYKQITLEEYSLSIKEPITSLYNKVFEVVDDARKCYIDGSTDAYNNHDFNKMMLLDGCFILFHIECLSSPFNKSTLLINEYLGAIELINIMRDMFLLENQIPFVVLEVLLNLKYPADKGEYILSRFFNYLKYGDMKGKDEKVLENKHPLHLLELYRSYFISLYISFRDSTTSVILEENYNYVKHDDGGTSELMTIMLEDNFNFVKRSRWFASATELKAKWVFLKKLDESKKTEDMTVENYYMYDEFKLARRAISSYTKAIYLNMMAYEMCPHNPNDFRISTYVRVMKSLIVQEKDVKEMRDKGILIHGLGRDEEVVKMFNEIEVPGINLNMYNYIRKRIAKAHLHKYKEWAKELITEYLSSPWKMLGLLVGVALLVTSFVQTYFAINPRGQ